MSINDIEPVWPIPPSDEEGWEEVKKSRFPDRYVEGFEREMAKALWVRAQEKEFPGYQIKTRKYGEEIVERIHPPLFLAAAGDVDPSIVGQAGRTITQARICAKVAIDHTELLLFES
jgi:hypothetical protein